MSRRPHGHPAPQSAPGSSEQLLAARAAAVLRLLLLPVVFIGNRLVAHPLVGTFYFNLVMAVATAYSVAVLVSTMRRRETATSHGGKLLIDLIIISALAFTSGRGFAQIRAAFIVAPMTAAMRLDPVRTAGMSAVTGALYILVALTHPVHAPLPVLSVLAHSLFVAWSGAAAVVVSTLRVRRERRIIALSEARGRLVAQTVEAEERVRKQISGLLHDNAIQDLLTARQDLTDAKAGDPEGLARANHAIDLALCQLRSTIEDLDPYLLDHLELPTALETIASRAARQGHCRIAVEVQAATAGRHTELVASLARELIGNAARHAGAARVTLTLRREHEALLLEISDDGRGFTHEQALTALRAGHIGLAASRERVEAVGGRLDIDSRPGAGTRVRCQLPLSDGADEDLAAASDSLRPGGALVPISATTFAALGA